MVIKSVYKNFNFLNKNNKLYDLKDLYNDIGESVISVLQKSKNDQIKIEKKSKSVGLRNVYQRNKIY